MSEPAESVLSAASWPEEVNTISARLLEEGKLASGLRRSARSSYREIAALRIMGVTPRGQSSVVYTHDLNEYGVGLILDHHLTVGGGAELDLQLPRGFTTLRGYIHRCRRVHPHWCEAAIVFYDRQPLLSPAAMGR